MNGVPYSALPERLSSVERPAQVSKNATGRVVKSVDGVRLGKGITEAAPSAYHLLGTYLPTK